MRKKPMRWLAAGMALCLTLVTTPAASAAQPPQDTPVFEEIVPYSLYIKNQGCDLMISDRTAFIEGWVSGQTGRSTECEVRVELQQKPAPSPGYWWTPGPTARTGPGHLSLRRCL